MYLIIIFRIITKKNQIRFCKNRMCYKLCRFFSTSKYFFLNYNFLMINSAKHKNLNNCVEQRRIHELKKKKNNEEKKYHTIAKP